MSNHNTFCSEDMKNTLRDKLYIEITQKCYDQNKGQKLNFDDKEIIKAKIEQYFLENPGIEDILIKDSDKCEEFISNVVEFIIDFKEGQSYVKILKRAKKWVDFSSKFKEPRINIIVFGKTQVGKTATVKSLFGLSDLKLKGNLKSDTSEIKEYEMKINNVTLGYTDTPGFFDSEGRDESNYQKLKQYLIKKKFHLIFWFAKVEDIIDSREKEIIEKLTKDFGKEIWDNLIIVLTHANNNPPDEYINEIEEEENKNKLISLDDNDTEVESDIDNDDDSDFSDCEIMEEYGLSMGNKFLLPAWEKYTRLKTKMWQDHFIEFTNNPTNIVLIENSKFHPNNRMAKDGDILLMNDEAVWGNMIETIFTKLNDQLKPFAFLLLHGEKQDKKDKKVNPRVLKNVVTQANINKKRSSWCPIL